MNKKLEPDQYANAPLIYTLSQVTFSHILKMKEYIPEIQERIRKEGFPKFNESTFSEFHLNPTLGTAPTILERKKWDFFNKDNTIAVSLTEHFLSLHTSQYTTFDNFSSTLKIALNILKEVVKPDLVERIGIRYINIIRPKENETFSAYLSTGLAGFLTNKVSSDESLTRCETICSTSHGTLVAKSIRYNDGTFLPPEIGMESLGLVFDEAKKPSKGEIISLLDFDHFSKTNTDFVVEDIIKNFKSMHDDIDKIFKDAVTDHAIKTWNTAKPKK